MKQPLSQHPGLNEMVFEAIRERIINGDFPPGFRLQEEVLINMIGTSKTPIKLALAKLEQIGLVRTIPRRGTYVIELTPVMLRDIYSLREFLEGLAARLGAQNLAEKEIQKLRRNLRKFDPTQGKLTRKGYLELDTEFHESILRASRNQFLQDALRVLYDFITMFKLRTAARRLITREAWEEHTEIVRTFETRNPDRAEEAMRYHIRRAMGVFLKILDQAPDTDGWENEFG